MKLNKVTFILLSATLLATVFSCVRKNKQVPDSMLTGQATIAADEAIQPLLAAELDVFHGLYHYASVDCKFVSEYDAVNLLLQEKIRLAIVARPLTQKEIDFFSKGRDIQPQSIPFAYDAVAVIVHPSNQLKVLTTEQISRILSGELMEWEQIPGSGMTGQIEQIFDLESSGIIRSLNDSLQLNKKISGYISFAGSNNSVVSKIEQKPEAIGFVGFNWLSENENIRVQKSLQKVNVLAVSKAGVANSSNSFKPSVGSLFNLSYPLTRRIYAIYTDPAASLARGFLSHLCSERGQKIIYRMGLKPESDFQRLVNINKNL